MITRGRVLAAVAGGLFGMMIGGVIGWTITYGVDQRIAAAMAGCGCVP